MDRSFIIAFDNNQMKRQQFIDIIDGISFVYNWYAFWSNVIVIISDKSTEDISNYIREKTNDRLRHIVVEMDKKNGLLHKDIADFIKKPKRIK